MSKLHITDGYTEIAAIPERGMVEVFFTTPGPDSGSGVVRAHFSEKLAFRLAIWMLWYWFWTRKMGRKTKQEAWEQRRKLELDAESEDLHSQ